jgi:hypothetical protein
MAMHESQMFRAFIAKKAKKIPVQQHMRHTPVKLLHFYVPKP